MPTVGHDAAMFQRRGVPASVLLIRNTNGSHNPKEHMEMADFVAGTKVLALAILEILRGLTHGEHRRQYVGRSRAEYGAGTVRCQKSEQPAGQSGGTGNHARRQYPLGSAFRSVPAHDGKGVDAELFDVDGHSYIDFVGEYSAGLFGHSNPIIKAAIQGALEIGTVMASPTRLETNLAEAVRSRFPSMELVRFCNSGTEANLMAW